MNRREKKRLYTKYLKKIDNAIHQEKIKKKIEPNLDHIELLEKLKNIMNQVDYDLYYELNKGGKFPKRLDYFDSDVVKWTYRSYNLPDDMEKLLSDSIVHREIAFKSLDI